MCTRYCECPKIRKSHVFLRRSLKCIKSFRFKLLVNDFNKSFDWPILIEKSLQFVWFLYELLSENDLKMNFWKQLLKLSMKPNHRFIQQQITACQFRNYFVYRILIFRFAINIDAFFFLIHKELFQSCKIIDKIQTVFYHGRWRDALSFVEFIERNSFVSIGFAFFIGSVDIHLSFVW